MSTCPHNADKPEDIVHQEGAQLDFSRDMSYGDYLNLDAILNAQKPLSPAHDELLFIVQHQTSELWMKLMLHELKAAIAHIAERLAVVQAAYEAPSLYDEALRLLARRGLPVPQSHTQRDWSQPYEASDEVEQAWLQVYRQPNDHWDLYQLGEELTDLEDAFRLWRFRHVTTVERVIGFKRGTGCWTWCCFRRSGGCGRSFELTGKLWFSARIQRDYLVEDRHSRNPLKCRNNQCAATATQSTSGR
jgi:tryptophan 2,3-dioxygenase